MLKKYYETMKELKKLDDVPLELPNDILRGGRHNITNYFMAFIKILLISLLLIIIVALIIKLISKLYYKNDNVVNYVWISFVYFYDYIICLILSLSFIPRYKHRNNYN